MTASMPHGARRDAIFDQLWTAAHGAFAERDYETACHALDAALARARTIRDTARVMAVGQEAAQQRDHLFQQDPDAARAAEPDGNPSRERTIQMVYASIARQAPAIVSILQSGA
jgi:uncharacterized protein HemY